MISKVVYLSELSSPIDWANLSGAVLCFGHFNTIHPGHIRYFLTARKYDTPLVVALEGDSQLPEAERDRSFGQRDRARAVSALDMIDHVVILDSGPLGARLRLSLWSVPSARAFPWPP